MCMGHLAFLAGLGPITGAHLAKLERLFLMGRMLAQPRGARLYLGEEGRRITRFTLPVCEDPH